MQLTHLTSPKIIQKYLDFLRNSGVPTATIDRKLASIRRFSAWALPAEPAVKIQLTSPSLVTKYANSRIASYINLSLLVLFAAAMAIFGYNQIFKEATLGQAYPQAPNPKSPNRLLSFQARLTDSSDNPITTPTDMRFIIYNHLTASGSARLWEEQRYLDPDQDGIFSVTLGTETAIPSSLFSENVDLWLGVTVETDPEATPRQRIATVGYALNAETLQGFPPSASASADQIPVITQEGDLVLAAASPMVYSSSGTFQINGQALSVVTASGTNGNITIAPDGTGQVAMTGSTTTQNFLRITNANLTSGHLISGYVGNGTATGDLLNLSSGAVEAEKFTVDRSGNTDVAGYLTVTGTLTANGTLDANGLFTLGDNGETGAIDTSDWDINTTGDMTGIGSVTSDGTVTAADFACTDCLDFAELEDTLDLDANMTLNQATYTWSQTFTGDTTTGLTYTANSLTSGKGLYLSSTSTGLTSGNLASIDWSPGSAVTATGDLVRINIGSNGNVGNLFNVTDNGSSLFRVSETQIESAVPHSFSAAGDVTMAYDLVFTNQTSSNINSYGPLTITSGESFENNNLTLATYGTGAVVVDSAAVTLTDFTSCTALETDGSGILTCGSDAGGGGSSNWQENLGTIAPINSTWDVLIGGSATTSAKFAFINVNSGTPTASISGEISLAGGNRNIQTTAANSLILGGNTSGSILFQPSQDTDDYLALSSDGSHLTLSSIGSSNLTVTPTGTLNLNSTGDMTLDSSTDIVLDADGADVILKDAATEFARLTNSSTDLIIDAAGGGVLIGTGTPVVLDMAGDDLFVTDDLEILGGVATMSAASNTFTAKSLTLATQDMTTLTLGNSNTGNIVIAPGGVTALTGIGSALTAAGTLTVTGTLDANGIVTLGDGGDSITLNGNAVALQTTGAGTDITLDPVDDIILTDLTSCTALETDGSGILTCGTDDDTSFWRVNLGALSPVNDTLDLLIGSNATTSAKFAVLNMNSGTPVASMSSTYLTSDGTLSTTARQSLTIGNSSTYNTTGNVLINPNGTGNVGIGTTGPDAKLDSLATSGEQLRLTYTDGSVYSGFTVDSSGNLTIDNTGTKTIIADDLQINGGDILTGNIPFVIGDGTTDTITLSTDGTGNGEIVLPNDSIGPNEIFTTGQTDEYCLTYEGTGTTWEWQTCGSGGGSSNWRLANGALSPINDTLDLLIGSNATASAKFAVLNVNSGTPTASVSANSGNNAAYLTGAGILGTSNKQTLQLGDTSTGNINFYSASNKLDSSGNLTVSGTVTAADFACTDCLDFAELEDTLDLDANLTLNQTTSTWSQTFTGDTTTGLTYTANSLTSGKGLYLSSTSTGLTSGNLASIDWSPGSAITATGDLVRINIGSNGNVGNLFNVTDNGSSLFRISETQIESAVPHSFSAAGDVTMAYDLVFTNQTSSNINSYGPLTITSGESFENNNLTLATYGTGDIVFDNDGATVATLTDGGSFTTTGDLTLDPGGGDVYLATGDNLNISGTAYFAGGTTYYVDSSGNAKFLDLQITDTGNPGLTIGNGSIGFAKIGSSNIYDDNTNYLSFDTDSDLIDEFRINNDGSVTFQPITSSSSTTEGTTYYDTDNDHLYLMDGASAWHRIALDMTKYASSSANIVNQNYIEIAHNQNTNDLSLTAWIKSKVTGLWEKFTNFTTQIVHNLGNQFNASFAQKQKTSQVAIQYNENDLGNGADGAATFSADTNINTASGVGRSCGDAVNYSVSSLTSTTATLEQTPSSTCLTAGDEVLLINLRGTNSASANVGNFETLRISGIASNVVTFTTSKTKYYGDGASDDTNIGLGTGNQAVMLQRVPNYTNVTVTTSGTDLTPNDWTVPTGSADANTETSTTSAGEGGVMFFRANGTVSIASGTTINANSKGYTAGAGGANTTREGGDGGEAFCGIGGIGSTTAGTNGAGGGGGGNSSAGTGGNGLCGGGGGGGTYGGAAGSGSASLGGSGGGGGDLYSGGGGGGYGSGGSGGSNYGGYNGSNGGTNTSGNGGSGVSYGGGGGGGGTYGDTPLSDLMFGSGGGGGGSHSESGSQGGTGGDGGGTIYIAANTLNVSGGIQSNGGNGSAANCSTSDSGGGGAGGAGGSIKLIGNALSLGSSLTTATAGTGANGCDGGSTSTGRKGGDGGTGRIATAYTNSISGQSSPAYGSASVENNNYAIFVSDEINTPNAVGYDKINFGFDKNKYGMVQFQTRSGKSSNSTDSSWEVWKPTTAMTTVQDMNTEGDFSGTFTAANGDITRNKDMFEDEDETTVGNTTKFKSTGFSTDTSASLDTSLYAYWPMNETSSVAGTQVTRYDAYSTNHLTDNRSSTSYIQSATGKNSNGADLESANGNFFEASDNSFLSTGNIDFSISAWIKAESWPAGYPEIISKDDSGTVREYDLYYDTTSSRLKWVIYNSGGTAIATVTANNAGAISTGTWYHVVAWHDSATDQIGIKVNNGTADTASTSGSSPSDTAANFRIGAYQTSETNYFDGVIDEVGFWKKTLTSTEITDLYNSASGSFYPTSNQYAEDSFTSKDLSSSDMISAWVYSTKTGPSFKLGFGESTATENEETFSIMQANTWQKVYWNITDIDEVNRDGVTKLRITNLSSDHTSYVDNVKAESLLDGSSGAYNISSTPNEYIQYRAILTTTDSAYKPYLYNINIDWNNGYKVVQTDANKVRLYNYTGETQEIKLDAVVFGADLAEWYTIYDKTIEPGDLVSLDGSLDEFGVPILKKAEGYNDPNLVGAISTKAGKTLGIEAENRRLLGLAGRIPVKIDPASPALQPGDYLTSSAISGYATLANPGEKVIGIVTENWDPQGKKNTTLIIIDNSNAPSPTTLTSNFYRYIYDTKSLINTRTNRPITQQGIFSNLLSGSVNTQLISPLSGGAIFIDGPVEINGDTVINGTLTAQEIRSSTIDYLKDKIANLSEKLEQETATAPANLDPGTLNAINELLTARKEASDSASFVNIASIEAQSGFFSEYLAVLGQATITDLQVTNNITLTTITGLNGTVDLAGDLKIFGNLTVEGNIDILGELTAPTASFSSLLTNNLEAVTAKIDELTTNQLIIASDATASAKIATNSASIATNATAGKGTLPAGLTEYTIYSPRVDSNSLVYISPVGDPQNQVLYVKAKEVGQWFKVAINQSLPVDLEFNWWIIKLETQ